MTVDIAFPRSRRALLASALGAVGALAAQAFGRPLTSDAADGDTVKVGGSFTGSGTTKISSSGGSLEGEYSGTGRSAGVYGKTTGSNGGPGVHGWSAGWDGSGVLGEATEASGPNYGVQGTAGSPRGIGVYGSAYATSGTTAGVVGESSSGDGFGAVGQNFASGTGVMGFSSVGVLPAGVPKTGVYGFADQDTDARAVYGNSPGGVALWGDSDSGEGVYATSGTSFGVYGLTYASDRPAILGETINGSTGVYGLSRTTVEMSLPPPPDKTGVYGYASNGIAATGVMGKSPGGTGVAGVGTTGIGIVGRSTSNTGIEGHSSSGLGVSGLSDTNVAVQGKTPSSTAILGYSGPSASVSASPKTGVFGVADKDAGSIGVRGRSATGRGGLFAGKIAQIRLSPAVAASHPAGGQLGDLFVDKNKRLWFCKGGTTWKQLA